jgi:hypothetical protein
MQQYSTQPIAGGPHKWSSERRPLLPIQPHPKASTVPTLPELPSPPRSSLIDDWYSLSTHIVPAAFPRLTPDVNHPPGIDFSPAKTGEEKALKVQMLRNTYYDLKVKHWQGQLVGHSEKKLWCCVNRYTLRRGEQTGRKKLTLFLAHANGFTKEVCITRLGAELDFNKVVLVDMGAVFEIPCFRLCKTGRNAL